MGGETPPLRRGTLLLCDLGGDRRADEDIGPYTRNGEPSVGAAVLSGPQSWTSCPGYAMVGGVISERYPPDFVHSGPSGPGARRAGHSDFARRTQVPRYQEDVPRKWGGRGKGACEHPLRVGAHRSRPPAIFSSFHRWKEHLHVSPAPRAEPSK